MRFKILIKWLGIVLGLSCYLLPVVAGELNGDIQSAEDYYRKGKQLLLEGDYKGADAAFKRSQAILDGLEQETSVPVEIGEERQITLEEKPSDSQEVGLEGTEPIIKIQQNTDEEIINKAESIYQQGQFEQASKLYKQALISWPKNYNVHYNLGVVYLQKGDYLNAAKEFETVISLNRRDVDAYYNLGVLYETFLSDQVKALNYYKRYLRLAPRSKEKDMVKSWVDYIRKQRIE